MPDAPIVSVITPAFNAAPYLAKTMESALNQTIRDIEILVADDGSTDGTRAIALEQARRDRRVRVLSRANGGPSAARNLAFRHAKGRFFALLDSDDWWTPTYLESQLAVFDRFSVDVVTNNAMNVGGPRNGLPMHAGISSYRVITLLDILERENAVCILSVFRRGVYDAIGGFDERLKGNEDYQFWIRAAHAGFTFLESPAPLAFYRRRADSVSSDQSFMVSGIIQVFLEARTLCDGQPRAQAIIDRQVARFTRLRLVGRAKGHLLRREYAAASTALDELCRCDPTLTYRLAAAACRVLPQSVRGMYQLKRVLARHRVA